MWRLAIALLISLSAVAQTPNCDSAMIPVRVMGIGSQPPAAIAKRLHIFLDGREVVPMKYEYGTVRRNTFILLDVSRSMRGSRLWSVAQDVTRLIAALTPEGEVRVAVFDRELSKFVGRDEIAQNGLETFHEFVATDRKRGTTSLFDAVAATLAMPRNATSDDVVIVVTDSGDNTSTTPPKKLLREVVADHVRVFAVLIAPSMDPDIPVVFRGREDFINILQKSGGDMLTLTPLYPSLPRRTVDPSGVALAKAAVQTWYTGVRSAFYFQLPVLSHAAKVKVELSPKIKDARVLYPRELPACAPRP